LRKTVSLHAADAQAGGAHLLFGHGGHLGNRPGHHGEWIINSPLHSIWYFVLSTSLSYSGGRGPGRGKSIGSDGVTRT
jgi:hypothetical protein